MKRSQRCWYCVTNWVDRAIASTGVSLTDLERRRLIAALLSRQHLILSGPSGSGKRELARALASSIAGEQQTQMFVLQGHPWWAANTGSVGHFVNLQTQFSVWQLAYFTESILSRGAASHQVWIDDRFVEYVVCVERMSPVEIELYFRVVSEWLQTTAGDQAGTAPIRLIGTYDNLGQPELDGRILRISASVHLG